MSARFVERLNQKKVKRINFKRKMRRIRKEKRESKVVHGQYIRREDGLLVKKIYFFICQDEN